jgi:dCMP deaminase
MRPNIHTTMLDIATTLSERSTCCKLKVGAVLVDNLGRIVGSGYNGVPRDLPHCTDEPCAGAVAPRGSDLCEAVHAEQNALISCHDPEAIDIMYCTHMPCMRCTKMLLNTSCRKMVVRNTEYTEEPALALWVKGGGLLQKEPL